MLASLLTFGVSLLAFERALRVLYLRRDYDMSYDDGHADGFDGGYAEGYDDGYEDGRYMFGKEAA
jgi:hypothetical protein